LDEPSDQSGEKRGVLYSWPARFIFIFALVTGCALVIQAQAAGDPDSEPWAANSLTLVLLFMGLLVGSGLVSSCETALFSLDKLDVIKLRNSPRWVDLRIVHLLDRPNDTLVTILILNNLINISISLTAVHLMERQFGPRGSAISFAAAALLATTAILLLGEIIPKMLANLRPMRAARLLIPPLTAANWAMKPPRVGLHILLRGLYRIFRIPETAQEEEVSGEELKVMIQTGEVAQVLEQDEREMIDGVFDLRRTVVAEILTPRISLNAVPDDLSQREMIARLQKVPNNRVIVYRESLDQPVGFLLVKEVLLDRDGDWRRHRREPLLVPEQMGLLDLLKRFRQQRTKMAIVVDEYGGLAGIVTLQDLLEEIVGDIYEKQDHHEREIEPLDPDAWRVIGTVGLDELGEELGIDFPEHKGRTVGGFVMNSLGRIPRVGDEVTHQHFALKVEQMIGRRVHRLRLTRLSPSEVADNGGGGGR